MNYEWGRAPEARKWQRAVPVWFMGVILIALASGVGVWWVRRTLVWTPLQRALEMGLDLIQWTFDPLQAMNAHLNFARLGVVVHEYEENVYGSSGSPLHRGNPTDRFVAEWRIHGPHVVRRLNAAGLPLRSHGCAGARQANRAIPAGEWTECGDVVLDVEDRRVTVEVRSGSPG